ncbi:MAG: hypothetical protein HY846_01290 [Nitrosomonadales bacterium]|nr:hypothetical protein [Nitrosomonadales bacterium]
MSLRPQEPHKENGRRNQHRNKKRRPQPRKFCFPALVCFAFISTHVQPFFHFSAACRLLETAAPEKGNPASPGACLTKLQNVVIQDEANENDIHQHPGKDNAIRKVFFAQEFHAASLPYLPLQLHILRM